MVEVNLSYYIDLYTGAHIGTGMGFAKMVDETVYRAGKGKGGGVRLPYIPGSSLKGKVKSRCEALAKRLNIRICNERKCKHDLCLLCRLFGSTFVPGSIHFSDAILVQEWKDIARRDIHDPFELSIIRTGNKLERATRTTEQDFLFSYEQTSDGLRFQGSIEGEVNTRPQEDILKELPLELWILIVGLQSVDKIGGGRSHGLGRCSIRVNNINGKDYRYNQLLELLGQDEYPLGLSEYDQKRNDSDS